MIDTSTYSQMVKEGDYSSILSAASSNQLVTGFIYKTIDLEDARCYWAASTNKLIRLDSQSVTQFISSFSDDNSTRAIRFSVTNGKLSATFHPSTQSGNLLTVGLDGLPYVPPFPSDYISAKNNSNTVELVVSNSGTLQANVKISNDINQSIVVRSDGIFSKKLTVAPNSTALAEISNDGQLTIFPQKLTDIHEATSYTTLASFVTAYNNDTWNPLSGKILKTADIIILAPSIGNYIYKGENNPTTVTTNDFVALSSTSYSETEIKAFFSATNGLLYNSGQFKLGGTLSENTEINLSGHSFTLSNGVVNIENLKLARYAVDPDTGDIKERIGTSFYRLFITEDYQLAVIPV